MDVVLCVQTSLVSDPTNPSTKTDLPQHDDRSQDRCWEAIKRFHVDATIVRLLSRAQHSLCSSRKTLEISTLSPSVHPTNTLVSFLFGMTALPGVTVFLSVTFLCCSTHAPTAERGYLRNTPDERFVRLSFCQNPAQQP